MGIAKSPRRVERLECRADGKCKLFIGGDPLSSKGEQGLKSGSLNNIGFAIDDSNNAGFDDEEEIDEEQEEEEEVVVAPSIKATPRHDIFLEGIEIL